MNIDFIEDIMIANAVEFESVKLIEFCENQLKTFWTKGSRKQGNSKNFSERSNLELNRLERQALDSAIFDRLKQFDNNLLKVFRLAISSYKEKYRFLRVRKDRGFRLLKYESGQEYIAHSDRGSQFLERESVIPIRQLTGILLLNDDYKGGELEFPGRKIVIKPEKNSIIIFPASFIYSHKVNKVSKGIRYSLVTWFI